MNFGIPLSLSQLFLENDHNPQFIVILTKMIDLTYKLKI